MEGEISVRPSHIRSQWLDRGVIHVTEMCDEERTELEGKERWGSGRDL